MYGSRAPVVAVRAVAATGAVVAVGACNRLRSDTEETDIRNHARRHATQVATTTQDTCKRGRRVEHVAVLG